MREIAQIIRQNDGVMLISHISPDGDTLGSACALLLALRAMGKKACAVCEGLPSANLRRMPFIDQISREAPFEPQVAIAVDCADARRIGDFVQHFERAPINIAIDHHATNGGYGQVNWIDPHASATGEMIYSLIKELGVEIGRDIATCLYIALSTDTGNFSYSNTTGNTLRIAAELLETGFDMTGLHRDLFRVRSFARSRLLGIALERAQLHFEGRMVMSSLTYKEVGAVGSENAINEGVIDMLRDIEGVEVAVYMHQTAEGIYRVSFRSNSYVDVCAIALEFGGGGHIRAAGCGIHGELEEIQSKIIAAVALCIEPPPNAESYESATEMAGRSREDDCEDDC